MSSPLKMNSELSTDNDFSSLSRELMFRVWGESEGDPFEVERMVRVVLNIPSRFPITFGTLPIERESPLLFKVQVGASREEWLKVRFDGRKILINGEASDRRHVPEHLLRGAAMYRRIDSLFE